MRPNDRSYLKSHEWCKIEKDTATIGISDYAMSHLSDLYSPVSGEVVEVNKDLPDNLEWLSQEPFGKAWMLKVRVTGKSADLMDAKAYDAHCAAEG